MLNRWLHRQIAVVLLLAPIVVGCNNSQSTQTGLDSASSQADTVFELPAASLDTGEKLRVVATTGIIADVVSNIGGDSIELTPLMPVGADPHSFTPTPQDLRALNDAHVIFMNGLGLEESLLPILENLDRPVPLVSVNTGFEPLHLEGVEEENAEVGNGHEHGGVDPHTWFSVPNVRLWAGNVATALGALDQARAEEYDRAAAAYQDRLDALDSELREQVGTVPEERRKLVTDHVALGYLAAEYGFETVGSILPSLSTLAAASAQELAALQDEMKTADVQALFVSTTVNPQTASQLANDLGIPVVELYTGSLSDEQGPAATYVDFMRYDVSQIVGVLR